MTIHAVGTEAACFNPVTGQSYAQTTTSGTFESNLSRGAMLVTRTISELELPFGTALTTLWMHAYIHQEDVEALDGYITFYDAAGSTPCYRIDVTASGNWSVYKYKSGSWSAALVTSSASVLVNGAANIDVHIVRHLTAGEITIYKDNGQVLTFSGDTDTDVSPEMVRFRGLTTNAREMSISQVIIADEDTKGMKVATLSPDGAGTNGDWSGAYTDVDEFIYDANDYIETNTTAQTSTFSMSDINATYSTYNVRAVVTSNRVSNDTGSAVADIQQVIRTGGADYASANKSITKDGAEHSVQTVWETNPDTSSSWTQSEVNAIESGVKSV